MTGKKLPEFIVNEYLTVSDLAKRWKKNIFTIYHWQKTKKNFPKAQRIFGNIVFKIQDVINYEKEILK